MNHAYHHIMRMKSFSVAARDLVASGASNHSTVISANEKSASALILQNLWYYQIWVTVRSCLM